MKPFNVIHTPATFINDVYRQTPAQVALALNVDLTQGLSEAAAQQWLIESGPNELEAEKPVPAWRRFLAQFLGCQAQMAIRATRNQNSGGRFPSLSAL